MQDQEFFLQQAEEARAVAHKYGEAGSKLSCLLLPFSPLLQQFLIGK